MPAAVIVTQWLLLRAVRSCCLGCGTACELGGDIVEVAALFNVEGGSAEQEQDIFLIFFSFLLAGDVTHTCFLQRRYR